MLPLALRITHPATGYVVETYIDRSPVRVGRADWAEVVLPESTVSQIHGLITFDAHETYYEDSGSRNGSSLGAQKLRAGTATRWQPGEVLRIGSLLLTCDRRNPPDDFVAEDIAPDAFGTAAARSGETRLLEVPSARPATRAIGLSRVVQEASRAAPAPAPPRPTSPPIGVSPAARPSIPPVAQPVSRPSTPPASGGQRSTPATPVSVAPPPLPAVRAGTPLPTPQGGEYTTPTVMLPASGSGPQRSATPAGGAAAPEPPDDAPPLDPRLEAQVRSLSDALAPTAQAYQKAGAQLDEQVLGAVQALPSEAQKPAWEQLFRTNPALAERPVLRARMLAHNIDYKSAPLAAETALRHVQALAGRLGFGRLERPGDLRTFVERLGLVLTLLAGVFVSLRGAVASFRRELFGITTPAVSTEWIERAADGDGLLRALLNLEGTPAMLREGVRRAVADLVSHEHGMFIGFRAAALALLGRFAPIGMYTEAQTRAPVGFWARLLARFQAYRDHLAWRWFSTRHAAMVEDERDIVDVLTGNEFVRAYNRIAVTG
jgi:predicted component of type VI protein secretion system